MDLIWQEFTDGWPDAVQFARIATRLVFAATLGALVGIQRERTGKPAGLRTHMLVSLGAALFVVAGWESQLPREELARIIQGICTGVGFIGAGAIIKNQSAEEISGLTTAAGIWLTAAVGVTAGLGLWGSALLSVLLTLIILSLIGHFENRAHIPNTNQQPVGESQVRAPANDESQRRPENHRANG